jgi:hypothetical protein
LHSRESEDNAARREEFESGAKPFGPLSGDAGRVPLITARCPTMTMSAVAVFALPPANDSSHAA